MSVVHENQTDLGKRLGVSRVMVGRWLVAIGFRTPDGHPTQAGWPYCKRVPVRANDPTGHTFYAWAVHAVLPKLQEYKKGLDEKGGQE